MLILSTTKQNSNLSYPEILPRASSQTNGFDAALSASSYNIIERRQFSAYSHIILGLY